METVERRNLIPLGLVFVHQTALATLDKDDMNAALTRHEQGDWGICSAKDIKANDLALREGFRLLSAYRDRNGIKFWIITEADRSMTTIFLPAEFEDVTAN